MNSGTAGCGERPVRVLEPDIQEERLCWGSMQKRFGLAGHVIGATVRIDLIIADNGRVFGDMLDTQKGRVVAKAAESMHQMLALIVEPKAAWARPIMPLECGHCPVGRQARLGEQVGAVE